MSTNPSFIDRVLNRVGLGEFTSPGISSDQTVEVEGYTLPKDFQRIIREGEALQALVASDGWKIILDRLEAECNKRLSDLKTKRYAHPDLIKSYLNRWRDGEDLLF